MQSRNAGTVQIAKNVRHLADFSHPKKASSSSSGSSRSSSTRRSKREGGKIEGFYCDEALHDVEEEENTMEVDSWICCTNCNTWIKVHSPELFSRLEPLLLCLLR